MASKTLETSEIVRRVLKSKDPAYSHLILSSVNVTVFKYEEQWINMEIEGAIHFYKRDKIPTTAIHILNRKKPQDFYFLVDKNMNGIETHDRFIIIKKAIGNVMEVFGLWFYDAHDCIEAGFILIDQLEVLRKSKDLLMKCNVYKK